MRKSVYSLIHSDQFCSSLHHNHSGRQNLNHGRPPKKLISKKNAVKKCVSKPALKRSRHSVFSTDTNCHIMCIQETTQQGPSSSSISEESVELENDETISLPFNLCSKKINSNMEGQRFFELKEYLDTMSAHMHSKQLQYIPRSILDPITISEHSRSKVICWIFDLSSKFRFKIQTPFLAANIFDRTIGLMRVPFDMLPLLGITALFMATKYEEIYIPHIQNFVNVVPQSYKVTKDYVLKLEGKLLNLINFDLGYTSPIAFIHQRDLESPLPETIKQRATTMVKQLIINSEQRYKASSKIANQAILIAEQDMKQLEASLSLRKSGYSSCSTTIKA